MQRTPFPPLLLVRSVRGIRSIRQPAWRSVLAAAMLASLAACASGPSTPTTPAGSLPHTARWDQQEWVVTALNGADLPTTAPRPTLSIQDGVASGTDGCNRYRRPLKPASDVPSALRFDDAGGVSTRMACPGDGDTVARGWNTAMSATRSVRTEPHRLALVDESGNVIARLAPVKTVAQQP
ncbi:META domain-containing protein [Roseateles sp. SL47]|uniref:META domain-containing protein n=1 Tax=Roseateles sp. SL47 TaxID=2995138 RepID=UPI0022704362|nr:META domain-containing protein [Roseateles sp. SL47]WAC72053.1 META domain-containing protein [Roseateles sp. SL47]